MIENRSRQVRLGRLALARITFAAFLSLSLAACGGGGGATKPDASPATDSGTPPPASTPSSQIPDAEPLNASPYITGDLVVAAQVGKAYSFTPEFGDDDKNDALTLSIENKPDWASFNPNTGALTGTPAAGNVGPSDDIRITVSDGKASRSIGPFTITVLSAADAAKPNSAPVIAGNPAKLVMALQGYTFLPSATDADGDKITWSVTNLPPWASFSTSTGKMTGTPSRTHAQTWSNIKISASDGKVKTDLAPFNLVVQPAPLTITTTPATSVTAGAAYTYTPSIDQLGSLKLTWSITNKPAWATFNTSSGVLAGTPTSGQAGTSTTGIKITATGGGISGSTATFTIAVVAGPNATPTITGSPATTVQEQQDYSFKPSANDTDAADTLSFSIQASTKPSWANFSIATGELSGTPPVGSAGAYAGIVISVSDGKSSKSLPPFTITVTSAAQPTGSAKLSWAIPTSNTDGTQLTTLAGFRINYGMSASNLSQVVEIANPTTTTYTVGGLAKGTWYFSVTSYNSSNTESPDSNLAQKTIN